MLTKKWVCDRCKSTIMEQDVSNRVIYNPCNEMITARVTNESLGIDSTFNDCSLNCFTDSIVEWYQKGVFNDDGDIHVYAEKL